jgi:hypothetical protein
MKNLRRKFFRALEQIDNGILDIAHTAVYCSIALMLRGIEARQNRIW